MTGPRPKDRRTRGQLLAEERDWQRTCEQFRASGWPAPQPPPGERLLRWPWLLAGLAIAAALITARAWGIL